MATLAPTIDLKEKEDRQKIKPGQEGSLGADCSAQTHEGRNLKIKIF